MGFSSLCFPESEHKSLIGFVCYRPPTVACQQQWISDAFRLFFPWGCCHCCNLQLAYTNSGEPHHTHHTHTPPVLFSYALSKANHVLCNKSKDSTNPIQLEPKIQRVFVFSMMPPDYWKSKFHALMMPMTMMMMTYTRRTRTMQLCMILGIGSEAPSSVRPRYHFCLFWS